MIERWLSSSDNLLIFLVFNLLVCFFFNAIIHTHPKWLARQQKMYSWTFEWQRIRSKFVLFIRRLIFELLRLALNPFNSSDQSKQAKNYQNLIIKPGRDAVTRVNSSDQSYVVCRLQSQIRFFLAFSSHICHTKKMTKRNCVFFFGV